MVSLSDRLDFVVGAKAADSLDEVFGIRTVDDLLLVAGGELVTVLSGVGVDPAVGEALQEHVHREHLGAELVTYHTGHRGDALLIGVE